MGGLVAISGSGYRLSPDGLREISDTLHLLAGDVRAIRHSWDGATRMSAGQFADPDCAHAFLALQHRLGELLGRRLDGLVELAEAAGRSRAVYLDVEDGAAGRFDVGDPR